MLLYQIVPTDVPQYLGVNHRGRLFAHHIECKSKKSAKHKNIELYYTENINMYISIINQL